MDTRIQVEKSEEDEKFKIYLLCCEHFSDGRPGDDWAQFLTCKHSAQVLCKTEKDIFVCQNCDSDNDLY